MTDVELGASDADSSELAALALDKPFFVGNNILERSREAPHWSISNVWDDDNISASSGPGRLAYDRRANLQTSPALSELGINESCSLIFYLDRDDSWGDALEVDTVAILNHNFADFGATIDYVYVDVSDDPDFTAGPDTVSICSWNAFTARRLLATNLASGNKVWTGVPYVRVLITLDAGQTFAFPPRIGEVVLGKRQQMTTQAQEPVTDGALVSESIDFRSMSGGLTRYSLYSGAGDRTRSFWVGGVSVGTLDPEESVRTYFRHTNHGQGAFLYVEKPISDPRVHLMTLEAPRLSIVSNGPVMRTVDLSMQELPPFVSSEP